MAGYQNIFFYLYVDILLSNTLMICKFPVQGNQLSQIFATESSMSYKSQMHADEKAHHASFIFTKQDWK